MPETTTQLGDVPARPTLAAHTCVPGLKVPPRWYGTRSICASLKSPRSRVEPTLVTLLNDTQQYPFGLENTTAGWDGHAWDGQPVESPGTPAIPLPKHGFLPFLRHPWFGLMVAGQLLVLVPAYLASDSGSRAMALLSIVGFTVFMTGAVVIFVPHLRFDALPDFRRLLAWGVVAGTVAVLLAHTIEEYVLPKMVSFKGELWLAGPVEETSKLLVPVLLLAFGSAVYKDPRAGFLLTVVSGATFGALEGVFYTAWLGEGWGAFFMGLVRPISELGHPFWTGVAGAMIWLGAWRRQRVLTVIGLAGYVIAMAQHSIHDGIATFSKGTPNNSASFSALTSGLVTEAVGLGVFALIWAVIAYLILRHAARELVPPQAIAGNHKHWRPQLKAWGLAR